MGKKIQLFKEIIDEITWKTALQDKGGEETLELLNNIFCTTRAPNSHVQKISHGWQEMSMAASLAKQKHEREMWRQ